MADGYDLIIPPALEPVSLEQAKAHLRVDGAQDDSFDIPVKLAAARRTVEKLSRRLLITQTWLLKRDNGFYRSLEDCTPAIEISKSPLQRVNSIKYLGLNDALDPTFDTDYDDASKLHTLNPAIYQVKTSGQTGWISPTTNNIWPYTRLPILAPVYDCVQIELVAGFGNVPEDVPEDLRSAILLQLGHLYANRESVITGTRAAAVEVLEGLEDLVWGERVVRFA